MTLQPTLLYGFPDGGLTKDKKPLMLADNAFSRLENAYVYRDRVKKREGLDLIGRLRRVLTALNGATIDLTTSPQQINVFYPTGLKGIITNITNAAVAQVTSPNHNLVNNQQIIISGVSGMTDVNGNTYTITVVDPNNFTIGVNSTLFGVYTAGSFGNWVNTTQPNATIERGSLSITIGAQTLTDTAGTGVLAIAPAGNITAAFLNYSTGVLTLTFTAPAAAQAVTITLNYFPGLPVMGIWQRDQAGINDEQTVWWDTKYAYIFTGSNFSEFIPGTTWSGSDSDFFSVANYRGALPSDRLFFATNFVVNASNPIRYTDQAAVAWTDFAPLVSATNTIYQARIIIPYYGRLVMLNVYEGTTVGGYAGALNIPNRAVFSALGNPLAIDAFRRDIFGKGGFIDAPVSQDIVAARFFKNTLIVYFERSTWQLRYVGEYGIPFIWERISSDFGCESTFSTILFDQGVASVGDRAITTAAANTVVRIDEKIPDQVFDFLNRDNGVKRVWGVRDFQRELAFWCFPDKNDLESTQYYPNKTLVYNYRNNTYAQFRNNVTAFGLMQLINGVTWDSLDVFWDDMDVTWDDVDDQSKFPRVVCGNQQGYCHYYGYTSLDETSLAISAIDLTVTPVKLTIPNHNLKSQEIIRITGILVIQTGVITGISPPGVITTITDVNHGLVTGTVITISGVVGMTQLNGNSYTVTVVNANSFIINVDSSLFGAYVSGGTWTTVGGVSSTLNNQIYQVQFIDKDSVTITHWDGSMYINVSPPAGDTTYIGNGEVTLFPKMTFETKDFNPYQEQGNQYRISNIDFQTDVQPTSEGSAIAVNVIVNSSSTVFGNLLVGNRQVENYLPTPFYTPGSYYAWHRFFATVYGQYIRLQITYDDNLMNQLTTHQESFELNAINLWGRPGGKTNF